MTKYSSAEQFFQENNIPYKTAGGGELRILCFFCEHPNQKCYVENSTGRFYCHHCGEGGGWKGLIRRTKNPTAVFNETPVENIEEEIDLPPIDPEIVERNHQRLLLNEQAPLRQYLYNRGLNHKTIQKFKLGWDGKNIVIPNFDANGNCVNFKLKPNPTLPSGPKGMFSIRGRGRKRLFNEKVLRENPEYVIISEGEWDCMLLDQHGYPAITSTAGSQSFDKSWVDAFKSIGKIYLAYDNDRNNAGQKGARRTASLFKEADITVFSISLPDLQNSEDKIDITDLFTKYEGENKFPELLKNAKPFPTDKVTTGGTDDSEEKEKLPITEELVELVLDSGCEIFLDSEKEPVIVFPEKPLVAFPLRSKEFHRWLSGNYYDYSRKGFSNDVFSVVVNTLEGKSYQENQIVKLYNRVAFIENVIYYDLGNDKNLVRIDSRGWEITNQSPAKFRRFKHQLIQVDPLKGGNLSEVLKYINITDPKEQLLLLTYFIAAFIPNIPRAVLVHTGDQGSAKSTGMRVIRSLIDPSSAELLIPPHDIPELALAANHHYCLYFDNLSHLSDQLSDTICRLVTGVGFTKRKLFTDSEEIILNQIVAVGITGIINVATKPDLLDRCLILKFERISDEKREDEGGFWQQFNNEKPYLLGAIFAALSKALQIVPNLKLSRKPRMADYAKYAAAAAIALDSSSEMFLTAFAQNIKRQNYAAIEASAVAQIVIDFMSDKEEWEGTSSELYSLLKKAAEDANFEIGGRNGFPKAPNWLWKKILPIHPNLNALGIYAYHDEVSKNSTIKLTKHQRGEKNTANASIQSEITSSEKAGTAILNNAAATNTATSDLKPSEPTSSNLLTADNRLATLAVDEPVSELTREEQLAEIFGEGTEWTDEEVTHEAK